MLRRILPVIAVFSLMACWDQQGAQPEARAPEFTITDLAILSASNDFGINLFQQTTLGVDENVIISPVSVSMALGMTINGAAGTTYDSMRTVLGLDNFTEEQINTSYKNLIAELTGSDPSVTMEIANSIWARLGMDFAADFLGRCEDYFDAVVEVLDFSDPAAKDRINGWVNDKTHGKIETILDESIPVDVVMYLINALYFKGTWTFEFDPNDTSDKPFTTGAGVEITIPTMMQETDLPYLVNEYVQAVDLPYGGEYFSMSIYLPHESVAIDSVIGLMTTVTLDVWVSEFHDNGVNLEMPVFKLEYKKKLNDALQAMGMAIAFSDGAADFSRMLTSRSRGLFIGEVQHKTFIEVNEEGTEAAAVTSVSIRVTSAPSYTNMKVNRPFIFVIRERASNALLFMGKVVDPTS